MDEITKFCLDKSALDQKRIEEYLELLNDLIERYANSKFENFELINKKDAYDSYVANLEKSYSRKIFLLQETVNT